VGAELFEVTVSVTVDVTVEVPVPVVRMNVGALLMIMLTPPPAWMIVFCWTNVLMTTGKLLMIVVWKILMSPPPGAGITVVTAVLVAVEVPLPIVINRVGALMILIVTPPPKFSTVFCWMNVLIKTW
jgi:hypothetical protein